MKSSQDDRISEGAKKGILLVFEIAIPIGSGAYVAIALKEPFQAILISLSVVAVVLLARIILDDLGKINKSLEQFSVKLVLKELEKPNQNLSRLLEMAKRGHLFQALIDDKLKKINDEIGESSIIYYGKEIEPHTKLVVEHLQNSVKATYLIELNHYWEGVPEYFNTIRNAAGNQNKTVERLFLLPSSVLQSNYDDQFRKSFLLFVREEIKSKIKVSFCYIDKLDSSDTGSVQDFGIWDNEVLCHVQSGNAAGDVKATYTVEESEINKSQNWWATLQKYSKPLDSVLKPLLDECLKNSNSYLKMEDALELKESAPIMYELANQHCQMSFVGGPATETCNWYHSSWQYLRMLDKVSTPDWHKKFYSNALKEVFQVHKEPNILISGMADYGTLSHVWKDSRLQNSNPRITLVDICQTPLEICRWYAKRHDFADKITFKKINIMEIENEFEGKFDLVITDAFLTRISSTDQKKNVISQWNKLLKNGRCVVTTVRVSKDQTNSEGIILPPNDNQKKAFEKDALHRSLNRAYLMIDKLDGIENIAKKYAENINSNPLDAETTKRLFIENGFSIAQSNIVSVGGEFEETSYLEIIAVKN